MKIRFVPLPVIVREKPVDGEVFETFGWVLNIDPEAAGDEAIIAYALYHVKILQLLALGFALGVWGLATLLGVGMVSYTALALCTFGMVSLPLLYNSDYIQLKCFLGGCAVANAITPLPYADISLLAERVCERLPSYTPEYIQERLRTTLDKNNHN